MPFWVKLGWRWIAAGTATEGWRIINTMGNRIERVERSDADEGEKRAGTTG